MARQVVRLVLAVGLLLGMSACGRDEPGTRRSGEPTYQGRTAASWATQLLASEDEAAFDAAWNALVELTIDHDKYPFTDALAVLHAGLASDDEYTLFAAAGGLGMLDRRALSTVDDLVFIARNDPDAEMRLQALEAIGEIAPPPRAFAEALLTTVKLPPAAPEPDPALAAHAEAVGLEAMVAALQDDDAEVRKTALDQISMWGRQARSAARPVSVFLTDPKEEVRASALLTLNIIDAPVELVLHRTMLLLGEGSAMTRRRAAMLLKGFGPAAMSAVPALEAMARDPEVRESAEAALEAIRGKLKERPFEPASPIPEPGAG